MSTLATLMFIVMFTLKLMGILTASWWVVTSPLWVGAIIFLLFLALTWRVL